MVYLTNSPVAEGEGAFFWMTSVALLQLEKISTEGNRKINAFIKILDFC
jgi:hypothetical protein